MSQKAEPFITTAMRTSNCNLFPLSLFMLQARKLKKKRKVGPKILMWMIACIHWINSAFYLLLSFEVKQIYLHYLYSAASADKASGRKRKDKELKVTNFTSHQSYTFTPNTSSQCGAQVSTFFYSTCNITHIFTSSVLGPNILLSMLLWNTLILCYSMMRDHTLITPNEITFFSVQNCR
jgi:hypothetical protein